jgi:hypothetical protein
MSRIRAGRDRVISYDILKRILEDPKDTEAYKMGLVDEKGEIIREPVTPEEEEALTTLDVLLLKIKELLGGRISTLRKYMYVKNFDDSVIEDIVLRTESKAQREYLKRIEGDIRQM